MGSIRSPKGSDQRILLLNFYAVIPYGSLASPVSAGTIGRNGPADYNGAPTP
jgi:hypothetical protein